MKIVYCVPSMYRLGGVERIVAKKASLLAKRGFDVSIITTDQGERPCYFEIDDKVKFYDLGINYEKNGKRCFLSKLYHFFYNNYLHKKRLIRLLLELKADIVISTFFNEMGILPKIKDGSKKIVEIHFSRQMFNFARRKGWRGIVDDYMMSQYIKSLRQYDRFVVLSKEDAENWHELDNVEVISNVCPIEILQKSQLIVHRVVSVGRYEFQKGYDRLIDAWALISKQVSGWTLHLVGEGSLRGELDTKIRKLGLENSVFLDGASKDISKVYLNSSIVAFTSHYEGFSLALVEAESAGLPVVSFDTPCGPKDIIRNGEDSFLVSNGDIETFAEKLFLLIKDESLRRTMGNKAYENSRRFTEEIIMSQWVSLFENVVKQ